MKEAGEAGGGYGRLRILSVPRARKMLGIPAEDDEPTAEAALVWSGRPGVHRRCSVCDECSHFIADTNHRRVQQRAHLRRPGLSRFIDRRVPLMPSDLKQRIQASPESLTARNRYNDQVTAQLTQALKQAEDEVARAILQYCSLGPCRTTNSLPSRGWKSSSSNSTTP